MTLKIRLISSIISFVMVASMMLIGIFATPIVTMQMGGNVSFTANSVYAKVTGSISGSQENPTETALTEFTIDYDDEVVAMPSNWTNMGLTFDGQASDIVVKMTIENLATDRAIEISLTDNSTTTNYEVKKTVGGEDITGATDIRIINGEEIVTYIFTLHVQSINNPASGEFLINYTLNNTEEVKKDNVTVLLTNPSEGKVEYKTINDRLLEIHITESTNENGVSKIHQNGKLLLETDFYGIWDDYYNVEVTTLDDYVQYDRTSGQSRYNDEIYESYLSTILTYFQVVEDNGGVNVIGSSFGIKDLGYPKLFYNLGNLNQDIINELYGHWKGMTQATILAGWANVFAPDYDKELINSEYNFLSIYVGAVAGNILSYIFDVLYNQDFIFYVEYQPGDIIEITI